DRCAEELARLATELGFEARVLPVSARFGDNVVRRSQRMPWYNGPSLIELLETIEAGPALGGKPFRMPVQRVNRANQDFRGYSGTVGGGEIGVGTGMGAGHNKFARVQAIFQGNKAVEKAAVGAAVTIVLDDEIDLARGDMLAEAEAPPHFVKQFCAHL